MKRKPDSEYYAERLNAEREAAANAATTDARRAHQMLADRYAKLLGSLADRPAADSVSPAQL